MDPLRIYDYLTTARGRLFDRIRPLGADGWRRVFPIGLNTVGRTLTHVMICEWAYLERLRGRALPPYETWPIQDEHPPEMEKIESVWRDQASQTRQTLQEIIESRGWDKPFEYPSKSREGGKIIVTATPGDIFTQLFSHEVHHRAQVMAMLRQMGSPAQDLDPLYFMIQRREVE